MAGNLTVILTGKCILDSSVALRLFKNYSKSPIHRPLPFWEHIPKSNKIGGGTQLT